ncbi:DUF6161 domain-containing protein [Niastella populi]|uniref:DUF6161 domain-containing protein n=1 Tax=Niastella populi TaxID=550983 RepID=A0A1V9EPY0_9BACT|nr:DUF6161 domain-containing protein [Niastella populi]OQP47945.1 hypothetical protein A4R26_31585 [Niastella populi]
MTISELKTNVSESSNLEWFNNRFVNLNYSHIGFKETITGITAIYEFLYRQIEGFSSIKDQLPDEIKKSQSIFEKACKIIANIVNLNQENENEWNNVRTQLERENPFKFIYNSSITQFLIKLFNSQPNYYHGAYDFITSPHLQNIHDKNRFAGYLFACEFLSKDYNGVANRVEAELSSVTNIKKDLHKYLTESEKHLTEYLSKSHYKVIDATSKIDTHLLEINKHYGDWFTATSNGLTNYLTETKTRVQELEDLYQEKLKLEAPAKYWENRAIKLRNEGFWWLGALITCIGIVVFIIIWILNKFSDGTIEKLFQNTGTAIKWSVLIITLISFLAYTIRTLSKLTFSSFHLFRDAQEREQLTYVYLSLQKGKGIDQTERHLIMQSLFSRADSGLLKDDGSPTMPGNIVDKFIANKP